MSVQLSQYDNRDYHPGAGILKRALWYVVNALIFHSWFWPGSTLKCAVLRLFGASVGTGVRIKPRVNIKYPWHLSIGEGAWIGEGVWIDNLTTVSIGSNACVSQGAYLLTGNHDYKDPAFGLIVKPIVIEEGAWVAACCVVCPGVRIGRQAILTVGSVLTRNALPNGIYRGAPAENVGQREIRVLKP